MQENRNKGDKNMNQKANEIKDNFIKGYDCSQVVFRHFAERFDLSEDEANRIAA